MGEEGKSGIYRLVNGHDVCEQVGIQTGMEGLEVDRQCGGRERESGW